MAYKLIVTEHADGLLDIILRYLIYQLKSEQAAAHLLDEVKNPAASSGASNFQRPRGRGI